MKCEVISIGSELTSGRNLDTNAQWLSRRLAENGLAVGWHTTVADDLEANTEAFRLAPAATVAPFEYLSIAWGACIDWIVWSAVPGARVLAGAGIVVGAGLYLVHRERMRT